MTDEQKRKVVAAFATDDARRKREEGTPPAQPSPRVARPSKAVAAPAAEAEAKVSPTLIVLKHLQVGDRQFRHGQEISPDLLPQEAVDMHLDRKELIKANERRSLYRLFRRFSGCSATERLSAEEYAALAL